MKTKAQRRRCRRRRYRTLNTSAQNAAKGSGYNTGLFSLACLGFPPPVAAASSRCSACVFCVPTCGKFGKLISSGGLQNFGPNLQNFLTRRKHRKQRRRQRSHLYAFTVFRPVCTKFKWQSMTPRLPLPTVRPLHCFRFLFAFARFGCLPFNSPSFFLCSFLPAAAPILLKLVVH